MDRSPFNQGFGSGQSPMSPRTPSGGSAYQVNVNRTKTKKWVEAKTQNYDGDDWGADEYEEEEEEPVPQPPLPQLPSQLPSQKAANTDKSLPPLQTQNPAPPAVSTQPKAGTVTSPLVSDPSSAGTGMASNAAQVVSPQSIDATQSFGSLDGQQPVSQTSQASSEKPLPFVRPSDIYRRMEVEKERERQSIDSSRSHPAGGIDQPRGRSPSPTKDVGLEDEADRRRLSTSPKLPDLARMSAFGPDLFGSGAPSFSVDKTINENDAEPVSPPPAKAEIATPAAVINQAVPGEPKAVIRDSAAEPKPAAQISESSQVLPSVVYDPETNSKTSPAETESQDDAPSVAAGEIKSPTGDGRPVLEPKAGMDVMQEIPPLRTPSPRGPKTAGPGVSEATTDPDGVTSTPTKLNKSSDFEPPPVHREGTFSTTTSSPVKDNDLLSDEILKSLSPGGSAPQGVSRKDTRESTYTLRDYDSYWEDTGDKSGPSSAVPPIPEVPSAAEVVQEAPPATRPESPPAAEETIISPTSGIRRKFSWEAEEDAAAAQPSQKPAPVTVPVIVAADAVGGSGYGKEAARASHTSDLADGAKPSEVASRALGVSHQVSNSSSIQPGSNQAPVMEAPSPISAGSDLNSPGARESTQISMADDTGVEQNRSSLVPSTATPPPEVHADAVGGPVTAPPLQVSSQAAQPQVMTFREILNLPTTAERIAKYNENRSIFSSTDSGLDNWLTNLKSQHPELVNGSSSQFNAPRSQHVTPSSNPGTPAGSQTAPSSQQPYYQQYLNASSPGAGSPTGRNRVGAQSSAPQSSGSAFGNSGNQIGTKSKEFMQSAGKMGKGLLSKGRSKLRGTGDKGESHPPPVQTTAQPKSKPDRRMSWGLSLGTKSRTDDNGASKAPANAVASATMPSRYNPVPIPQQTPPPPQVPEIAPLSPLNPAPHPEYMPGWRPSSQPQPVVQLSPTIQPPYRPQGQSPQPSRATAGLAKLEIPGAASPRSTVGPNTAPALHVNPLEAGRSAAQAYASRLDPKLQQTTEGSGIDSDWVMVPASNMIHEQESSLGGAQTLHSAPLQYPSRPLHEDSGVGLASQSQTQPDATSQDPKRASSFIGLPPIRRSSTFGLSPKTKARRATDRFPLEEDDDDEADQQNSQQQLNQQQHVPTQPDSRQGLGLQNISSHTASAPNNAPAAAPPNAALGLGIKEKEDILVSEREVGPESPMKHPAVDAAVISEAAQTARVNQGGQVNNGQVQNQMPVPGQHQQHVTNPVQRLPPSGPWKLEESHLAEPLHAVTRNRSGTAGSQQGMFGFDKETGLPSAGYQGHGQGGPVPPPAATPPSLRQRSDVPPSSAQRYPDLFAYPPGQQRSRANSRGNGMPYQGPYQQGDAPRNDIQLPLPRSSSSEFAIPGVGPPPPDAEDRGRRRNSGVFRDIGQRIVRAASRERRSSVNDSRPAVADIRGDEMSESSIATSEFQDKKKKRHSFMLNFPGRGSMDQGPRGQHQQSVSDSRPPGTPPSPRRRSFFGAGVGGKLIPSGLARSSTSNLVSEPQQMAQNTHGDADTTPQKKRFSGMSKMFNRGSQQPAAQDTSGAQPYMEPPSAPFRLLGRTSTSNSSDMGPPDRPTEDAPRRGRRGSMSGLISGMLGKRSSSKTRGPESAIASQQTMQPQSPGDAPNQGYPHRDQFSSPIPQPPAAARASLESRGSEFRRPPSLKRGHSGPPVQKPEPYPMSVDNHATPRQNDTRRFSYQRDEAADISQLQQAAVAGPSSPDRQRLSIPRNDPARTAVDSKAQDNVESGDDMRLPPISPTSITSDWRATEHQADQRIEPSGRLGQRESPIKLTAAETFAERERELQDGKSVEDTLPPTKPVDVVNDPVQASNEAITKRAATSPIGPKLDMPTDTHDNHGAVGSQSLPPVQPVVHDRPADVDTPPPQPPRRDSEPVSQSVLATANQHGTSAFNVPSARPHQHQTQPQMQPPAGYQIPPSQFPQGNMPYQHRPYQHQTDQPMPPQQHQQHPSLVAQHDPRLQGTPPPHMQPPQVAQQSGQGAGSKWKGLKNRMSEQMSSFSQPSEPKPPKTEKPDRASTGNKLLGAFKRQSKQGQPSGQGPAPQPMVVGGMQQPPSQWQPGAIPPPQPQRHPENAHPAFAQHHAPPGPGHIQHFNTMPLTEPQNPLRDSATRVPPQMQTQMQNQMQNYGNQQPTSPQSQSMSEPRYDFVPIPRGYNAVHGEGGFVPTAYNVGRRTSQPLQHQMQQSYAMQASGVGPQLSQQQSLSPPTPQSSFPRQDSVSSFGIVHSASPPSTDDQRFSPIAGNFVVSQQQSKAYLDSRRDSQQGGQNSRSVQGQDTQHANTNDTEPPSKPTVSTISTASPEPSDSASVSQQTKSPVATQQPISKPDDEQNEAPSTGGEAKVDDSENRVDENIYDSTPRLNKDITGGSGKFEEMSRTVSNESLNNKTTTKTAPKSEGPHAELEDTADAHQRRLRIASQEEKIWCDPEDDPEYQPQMSATSYPGQEWNPYGEPEFVDYRDE